MVLILSDNLDPSTNRVIDWLNYLHIKWFRVNESDTIRIINIEFNGNAVSQIRLLVNDTTEIDLIQIKSYWYRRGFLNTKHYFRGTAVINEPSVAKQIKASLIDDDKNIITFIHQYLKSSKVNINSFLTASNDKTNYLLQASLCGLAIPDSIICDNQDELSTFFNKHEGKVICKSINEGFSAKVNGFVYYNQTNLVSSSDVQNCDKSFFPSLFQKNIDKFIELRIFYIHGEFYAMAIFSQQNEKTRIDFRNYDRENPNRNLPYQLPKDIEEKLNKFMNTIDMNCGSIDMILTNDNEYIFLEVNPVGQFSMVSIPCNYYLEKRIAEILN
jgi:ATP-GRASP peptide maturase of grasp-with-spasm system